MSENREYIVYNYSFRFKDDKVLTFPVRLDSKTLNIVIEKKESYPLWTLLENDKCTNCPLDPTENQFCPIAVSLVDLINFFKDSVSYETVEVQIQTHDRNFWKELSLQQGISSLIGIYMVTSGCPHLEKLKPMVRFHLPFATPAETTYRAVSMYLTAQYLKHTSGLKPDWDMSGLVKIYNEIETVNICFAKRLRNIEIKDASVNAVAILSCFGDFVKLSVTKDMLSDMKNDFRVLME